MLACASRLYGWHARHQNRSQYNLCLVFNLTLMVGCCLILEMNLVFVSWILNGRLFIWDTCQNLWKQWNIVIFDNGNHFTEDIAKSVEKSLQEDKKRHMRVVRQIGWEAPQQGRIKIDTDGAVGSCQMGVQDIA